MGVIGTLGASFLGKTEKTGLTTPDPIELHQMLAKMCALGVKYVVMEVSAHALWYKKVEGIPFAVCIFTNFTQDHLDFFSSMKEYRCSKARLFEKEVCPIAVLNGDEETGRLFGKARGEAKTVYYGLNSPTEAFAVVTDENLYKTECVLNIRDKLCRASLSLAGRHNVYNAIAAATCARELGIGMRDIEKGLFRLKSVCGRLERVCAFAGAEIFVDFAHTPDGLAKSLETLRAHLKGRLVCVFGCGGNRDRSKRPLMGETVAKKCDLGILTSDNPRYEDPLDILSDIERGYRRFSQKYVVVPDRKHALRYAVDILQKDDILLVAGKGGEDYQEIMGIKYPFVDNDIIQKICKEKEAISPLG